MNEVRGLLEQSSVPDSLVSHYWILLPLKLFSPRMESRDSKLGEGLPIVLEISAIIWSNASPPIVLIFRVSVGLISGRVLGSKVGDERARRITIEDRSRAKSVRASISASLPDTFVHAKKSAIAS
jgi:hypothetical protein